MRVSEEESGTVQFLDCELLSSKVHRFGTIEYFRSKIFGNILTINNEVQHVEKWIPFYHELVVHLSLIFSDSPRDALILGGGSLFAAREVLKYKTIKKLYVVDHCPEVTNASLDAYPELRSVVADCRLQIIESDALDFLVNCQERFDFILNDAFDLTQYYEQGCFNPYLHIYHALSNNGIVSDLIYRSIYDEEVTKRSIDCLSQFQHKAFSLIVVPDYPGIFHILAIWGRNRHINQFSPSLRNSDSLLMHKSGLFEVFNPNCLSFYFYIPPYIRRYFI